jgi:hypothetical protein
MDGEYRHKNRLVSPPPKPQSRIADLFPFFFDTASSSSSTSNNHALSPASLISPISPFRPTHGPPGRLAMRTTSLRTHRIRLRAHRAQSCTCRSSYRFLSNLRREGLVRSHGLPLDLVVRAWRSDWFAVRKRVW